MKAVARENRGRSRVFTAVPVAGELISALGGRGGNIAVARLGELLDAFGAEALSAGKTAKFTTASAMLNELVAQDGSAAPMCSSRS